MVLLKRLSTPVLFTIRTMSTRVTTTFTKSDIASIVPPLTPDLHKGQCGRIAVVGGSIEYTGAPYYAAMTTLRLGGDLAHVFCYEEAGTAIKSYSPDLIVHPVLKSDYIDLIRFRKEWLPRMHAVVFGPGLGRKGGRIYYEFLEMLKELEMLTLIDADGLHIVTQNPKLLKNFKNVILTPNAVEYVRLVEACVKYKKDDIAKEPGRYNPEDEGFLTQCFPDAVIVRKGPVDRIYDWASVCEVGGGSSRRCGGQGDVLAGAIALFTYWSRMTGASKGGNLLGAYAGCFFTRKLNERVFSEKGRSMVTGDFIDRIGITFDEMISGKSDN